ncbi:MAG: GTP pyrophosphokinase [Muribaculaceae bacterium]|nr:GTP pyrophosphokinase [Muribaculaceae bacterium]
MTKEQSAQLLDKAAMLCVVKHGGQRDKGGSAYFQHPMRVAMKCTTDEEKMVALLHDIIEDTDVTADYLLREGFPRRVVDGVIAVTKRDGEKYEDFVTRAGKNPLGRIVKIHDLEDNLDLMRLDEMSPEAVVRLNKYLRAYRYLKEISEE